MFQKLDKLSNKAHHMVNKMYSIWYKNGWEILVIISLIFIIGYFILENNNEKNKYIDIENKEKNKYKYTSFNNFYKNYLIPQYFNKNENEKDKDTIEYTEKTITESKGENICRNVLQNHFQKPFNKKRPSFLLNTISGQNLELDCYNEELKLAVEYHGRQHYEFVEFFHKYKSVFREQQYRDQLKILLCQKFNVTLIIVPYTVKLENIEKYLKQQLKNF